MILNNLGESFCSSIMERSAYYALACEHLNSYGAENDAYDAQREMKSQSGSEIELLIVTMGALK